MLMVLLLDRFALLTHLPPSSTSRRVDNDPLTWLHERCVLPTKIDIPPLRLLALRRLRLALLATSTSTLLPSITRLTRHRHLPHPYIPSNLRILSAFQPIRPKHPPLAQNAHLHRNSKLNIPDHTLATPMLPLPRASCPEAKLPQNDRIPPLKHLRVRDPRICHVRVHAARAIPRRARTAAACDSFVVPEAGFSFGPGRVAAEAEGQVVAVALGGGASVEGAQDDVGDALGGEDVAADDGGFIGGGEEGARGDLDGDGFETALVSRLDLAATFSAVSVSLT